MMAKFNYFLGIDNGCQKDEEEDCEDCDGTGYTKHGSADEHKCETCNGTGIKPKEDD